MPCSINKLIIIKRFNTSSKKNDVSIKLNDSLHACGKEILLKKLNSKPKSQSSVTRKYGQNSGNKGFKFIANHEHIDEPLVLDVK